MEFRFGVTFPCFNVYNTPVFIFWVILFWVKGAMHTRRSQVGCFLTHACIKGRSR